MRKPANYLNKAVSTPVGKDRKITSDDIIGQSQAIKDVKDKIRIFAGDPSHVPILITGERGTGKEMVARAIYNHPDYVTHKKCFLPVNCGGLHEDTQESQLFGYEKGAFTGADKSREGILTASSGGTVFLDEAGNLSEKNQSAFHRALQQKTCIPLGGTTEISFDVRVILATNRNLKEMSREESFMPDLYDRIRFRRIHIPPLRHHKEDIPLLAAHFLEKHSVTFSMPKKVSLHSKALKRLMAYDFPGNVRELEGILENAMLTIRDEKQSVIESKHLVLEYDEQDVADNQDETNPSIFMKLVIGYIQRIIDKNRALWEDVPIEEVPCLFDMLFYKKILKKVVYVAVGCNKARAAKLLNLSVHQFDEIEKKHPPKK